MIRRLAIFFSLLATSLSAQDLLQWRSFDPIPSELGVAGPYTGVHGDVLVVAGGANFPEPVWENDKVWHDAIYAFDLRNPEGSWKEAGTLSRPLGYGTTVSLPEGILCIGGNDADQVYGDVFLLRWTGDSVAIEALPSLPNPLCYATAAVLGDFVYLAGGQTGPGLETATKTFLRFNLAALGNPDLGEWQPIEPWPGSERAFSALVTLGDALHLVGGRHLDATGETVFLSEHFRFVPDDSGGTWTKLADHPAPLAAGTAAAFGDNTLVTLAGADGSLFAKSDELKDDHPGFPKAIHAYDAVSDDWFSVGEMPANQVTTEAVPWRGGVFIASGEVRPRVRTPDVWRVLPADAGAGSPWERWKFAVLALIVGIPLSIFVAYRSRARKSIRGE